MAHRSQYLREVRRPPQRRQPQYLLLNYPVWYVLAYDPGRQAIRTFRCDRLQAVQPLGETFRLRGVADFRVGLEGLDIDVP